MQPPDPPKAPKPLPGAAPSAHLPPPGQRGRSPGGPALPLADRLFRGLTRAAVIVVLGLLFGILGSLVVGGWPALRRFSFGFLTTVSWNPVTEVYGAVGPVYGTLVTSAIAIVLGVPTAFGIALFLTQIAPRWMRRPVSTAIELLAAIPSIIYGMWGLFVFAPLYAHYIQVPLHEATRDIPVLASLFTGPPLGLGLSTAGIILAIMIVPFIAAVMRDVFDAVPRPLHESAHGLGATTWEVMWRVIVPYTRVPVIGAIMLGLGRALGETMAVTFIIGNSHNVSPSLFKPGSTIASTIANEFAEAFSEIHTASLLALGLVLFVITFIVLAIAKLMLARLTLPA